MSRRIQLCTVLIILLSLYACKTSETKSSGNKKDQNIDFSDLEIKSSDQAKKIIVNINLLRDSQNSNIEESSQGSSKTIQVNLNLGEPSSSTSKCEVDKYEKVDQKSFCPKQKWLTNEGLDTENKRFLKVNTKYGNQMFIDSFDKYKSQELRKTGVTYPGNIYLIGKLMKKGAKVLNLGAHNGMESILVGRAIGPCGHLYIFEPYSVSYRILRKNLEINGILNRATTYNIAAHNTQGSSDLHISYKNTGGNSVVSLGWTDDIFTQKIQLKKVDDVLPQDVQLDFALIDVERVEANALLGMKKVIERSPKLIMIVQWQTQFDVPLAKEALNFLLGRGYKMFMYEGKNVPCELGYFTEIKTIEELLKIKFVDVIFVPKDVSLPK